MLIVVTKNKNHKKTLNRFLFGVSTNVWIGDLTIRERDFLTLSLENISDKFKILEFSSNFDSLKEGVGKENFLNNMVDFFGNLV